MIKYGLVARGTLTLADYSEYEGDFALLSKKILAKAKKSSQIQCFQRNNYLFSFVFNDEVSFLVMTDDKDNASEVSCEFLDVFRKKFHDLYEKQDSNWQKDLTLELQNLMRDYNNQQKTDKVTDLENQIEEVQEIAKQSIDSLLDRGSKLETLNDKSKQLQVKSNHLKHKAKRLKRKMDQEGFPTKKIFALLILGFIAGTYIIIKKTLLAK